MNNKGRRNELTKLKHKKRLKNYGITRMDYSFKHSGKPCSCFICKRPRYIRKKDWKYNQPPN